MQIKVFKAETMKDAMAAMKAELGEDAVILHSRKYKSGGFFGFGGKEIIEITAAVEAVPLAERVRGIYKKPPKQMPVAELEGTDANSDGDTSNFQSAFNDELPIDRPEISSLDEESTQRARSENEKLAATVRNAQNPPPEEPEEIVQEYEPVADYENVPVENELPADENLSAEGALPIEDELPADENLPADGELPAEGELPVDENLPVEGELPVDENLPVEDEMPAEGELPADENLPIDENLPPDEYLPADEYIPTDEGVPIDDGQYTDEQTAQGFGFTPEQLAQAQAMMFAQFNQYQMAMQQAMAQAQAQAQVAEMAEQMREIHRRRTGKADAVKLAQMSPEEKKIHRLESEVARMKSILSGVVGRGTSPNSVTLREALTYQEIDEDILEEMDADPGIGDTSADVLSGAARLTLSNYLEEHLKFSGGIKLNRHGPRIVAVLGTTGVGKTTTLAKIAAKFVLDEKIEAVLITADTYRISAVEQLKTYSDILGLPLEIVYSPAELSAALDRHKDRELILIDTAGRSRQSFQQMQDLKDMLSVHSRIEKHLVISATTKITDARDMMDKFAIVEPEKIIITKVDETGTLGLIPNLLKDKNIMLSYFTTGQGVPEDIELANVNILTDLFFKKILGE
ncbi:MAG: hypothetical protein IJU91_10620 [Selenomonadaceae bacterium]|nr:hypothetical protein [Selenomonadaceae bacterium]